MIAADAGVTTLLIASAIVTVCAASDLVLPMTLASSSLMVMVDDRARSFVVSRAIVKATVVDSLNALVLTTNLTCVSDIVTVCVTNLSISFSPAAMVTTLSTDSEIETL